jgi:hypothetical protein
MYRKFRKEGCFLAEMCVNNLGCILSHAEKEELISRVRQIKQDYEKYAFDGAMLDCIKEFLDPEDCAVIVESAKNERCSKQFYHMEPMMEHLNEFMGEDAKDRRGSKAYRAARVLLIKSLPKTNLIPEDIDEAGVSLFSNTKGAAGAIAKGSKGANADICLDVAHRIKRAIAEGRDFDSLFVPTMCYHRSQISDLLLEDGSFNPDFKMKDRMVEGLDGGTTMLEASYFKPVYKLWKNQWACYAGGKTPSQMRDTINYWRTHNSWLGTDFSKFDMHLPAWLLEDAFEIMKELYFDKKYWSEIDWIKWNFIHTVLIGPDGQLHRKRRGIPSGSFCTQIVGTLVNLLMNLTGMAVLTGQLKTYQMISKLEELVIHPNSRQLMMMGMGDDCLIFFDRTSIDRQYVEKLAEVITTMFGVKVQPAKTDFGDEFSDPLFLKREWRHGGEYQNPRKLFINLIHPEHDRKYDNYSPWHILYGMWLTYRFSFPSRLGESYFFEKMRKHPNGLEALRDIPLIELPGVFRGFGESPVRALYEWAQHRCT